MVNNDELVQLKPKQIIHNNIYYYVKIISVKIFPYNEGSNSYFIQLYKKTNGSRETLEEADIIKNYKIVFEHDLDIIIDELEKNNVEIRHSPTFIQNIMEKFFEIYLKETVEKNKNIQEKLLQITNYESWDGIIKYE